jgi:hypothetical protein
VLNITRPQRTSDIERLRASKRSAYARKLLHIRAASVKIADEQPVRSANKSSSQTASIKSVTSATKNP